MKLTEEHEKAIKSFIGIYKCPNCDNDYMNLLNDEFHLISANTNPEFKIDLSLPVAVYHCRKCFHIMMFSIPMIHELRRVSDST